MSHYSFNPSSLRARKTHIAKRVPNAVGRGLQVIAGLFALFGTLLLLTGHHQALSLLGIAVCTAVALLWFKRDLGVLPQAPIGSSSELSDLLPIELISGYRDNMPMIELANLMLSTSDGIFMQARFDLVPSRVDQAIGEWNITTDALWTKTDEICKEIGLPVFTIGATLSALFALCPNLSQSLASLKMTLDDIDEGAHWLARLSDYRAAKKPSYGGIARDWASGFTPLLSRYGNNLSREVELANKYFVTQERTTQLDALVSGLDGVNGSVVLVGEPGIGKSALLFGLADRLLQGKSAGSLAHHQIISLSASIILANAQDPGEIEQTVLLLFSEATHAGNIIIALDEAQLFFGQGTGAVNLSQVLLPILQSRSIKLVLAITPGDWQKLRAMNSSMASLLSPLVLTEPTEKEVKRTLADRALLLEGDKITTWNAVAEIYRLSGRYFEDEAYPGKALKLLEASIKYADVHFISEQSVQLAIENQFGVKVHEATGVESDALLHLEDRIHERMINQTRAVSVVSNALRRARAGVANPKRPIGSFLFLGPTGVGKTELAKSLAALYFGSEQSVIRLDMSEFQQIADVDRILASGAENPEGLLSKVRQSPFSVVLFDEIEKAHANVLNLFLQLLDEGHLTDTTGHQTSFKDTIIIATSNAGADEIRRQIEAGQALESFEAQFTNDLINSGAFKPELLNRFDEIVLFRPLNEPELIQVVKLMIGEVNQTLASQKIVVKLTQDAAAGLVHEGYDPRLGARPMRRMVTRKVEDTIAQMILRGEAKAGDTVTLDATHLAVAPSTSPVPATTAQDNSSSTPNPPVGD
jgi:ATP-dependent Clp protease ATP-binding subunit ClpC